MHRGWVLGAVVLVSPNVALAEDVRVHVAGGAARPVSGAPSRDFGAGGGARATVELPLAAAVGVQGGLGGLLLASGDPPEAGVASKAAGTALFGTVGARLRPFGARRVAGPWVDANGGVAQTGSLTRPVLDAHVGWDFRVSREARWDVGPFVGYTQIVQPDSEVRGDDARVLWAGIQVSLGAPERARPAPPAEPARAPAPPPRVEAAQTEPEVEEVARVEEEACETGDGEGCEPVTVELVADRIVLDETIHFRFGSPDIQRRSERLVREVARFIERTPDILEISIEGHADAIGSDEVNQRLSEARAASTRAMLIRFGVDASRLKLVGHGKSRLKVPTPKPSAANRRVEFIVTRVREGASPGPSAMGGTP